MLPSTARLIWLHKQVSIVSYCAVAKLPTCRGNVSKFRDRPKLRSRTTETDGLRPKMHWSQKLSSLVETMTDTSICCLLLNITKTQDVVFWSVIIIFQQARDIRLLRQIFCRAMLRKRKKLPRKRKCIFNKSANVESIKPQPVTPKAQHRQCQSYTE